MILIEKMLLCLHAPLNIFTGVVQSSRNICRNHNAEYQKLLHYTAALTSRAIPVRSRSGGGGVDGTDGSKGENILSGNINRFSECQYSKTGFLKNKNILLCNSFYDKHKLQEQIEIMQIIDHATSICP